MRVDDSVAIKPGQLVGEAARIEAEPAHPWVSRGGVKLAHALDVFGVDVAGRVCLDVGASTGGFTDVLLARGARRVVAVDVGKGQLHPKLKADARVAALEERDARELTLDMIGQRPSLVTCDASFIGLAKVLPRALELAAAEALSGCPVQTSVRGRAGEGGQERHRHRPRGDRTRRARLRSLAEIGWLARDRVDAKSLGGGGKSRTPFLRPELLIGNVLVL